MQPLEHTSYPPRSPSPATRGDGEQRNHLDSKAPRKHPRITLYRLLFLISTLGLACIELALVYMAPEHSNADAFMEVLYNSIFVTGLYWIGIYEQECPGRFFWLFTDLADIGPLIKQRMRRPSNPSTDISLARGSSSSVRATPNLGRMSLSVDSLGDNFAAGPHYGPVLVPFELLAIKADICLNPLLAPVDASSMAPYLKWNMLWPAEQCVRSDDPQYVPWLEGRNAPATFPRTTYLRLVSTAFPWPINVLAPNQTVGVTCGDVLDAIGWTIHGPVAQEEFERLPRARKRLVIDAYWDKRSRSANIPGSRMNPGLLRIDWLLDNTRFGGIRKNERLVRARCDAQSLPCTFELLCVDDYILGDEYDADEDFRITLDRIQRRRRAEKEERATFVATPKRRLRSRTFDEDGVHVLQMSDSESEGEVAAAATNADDDREEQQQPEEEEDMSQPQINRQDDGQESKGPEELSTRMVSLTRYGGLNLRRRSPTRGPMDNSIADDGENEAWAPDNVD